jgi:hypothetical protein
MNTTCSPTCPPPGSQCAYGCPHGYTRVDSLGVHLKEKHRHKRKRYFSASKVIAVVKL